MTDTQIPASLQVVHQAPDSATLVLSGEWTYAQVVPDGALAAAECAAKPSCKTILFEASGIRKWDSALLTFLMNIDAATQQAGLRVDRSGLPEGVQKLLALASAVRSAVASGAPTPVSRLSPASGILPKTSGKTR